MGNHLGGTLTGDLQNVSGRLLNYIYCERVRQPLMVYGKSYFISPYKTTLYNIDKGGGWIVQTATLSFSYRRYLKILNHKLSERINPSY